MKAVFFSFLPRDAMNSAAMPWRSVRPSVTFMYCIETTKMCSQTFSPPDSPAFFHTKRHGNISTGDPITGTSNAGAV